MDSEERIVSLAKPVKKGLLRLIFSRFFYTRNSNYIYWANVNTFLTHYTETFNFF